jgi:tetratricopeptide (TPR) repeat protein
MSSLKALRKFLKSKLVRYPISRRIYEAPSFAAETAKLFLARLADRFVPTLLGPRIRLTRHYFSAGKLDRAVAIGDDVLARRPDRYDVFNWLAHLYSAQGRSQDASRLFARLERRNDQIARELQLDRLGLRFFLPEDFAPIGHLGVLDKYLKAESWA